MKFQTYLKNHCIETALKRLYNKSISEYFKNPTKSNENKLSYLELALKNLDFPSLRSTYPELNGNLDSPIEINFKQDKIIIKIPGRKSPIEINFSSRYT
ncbi:hypothetical protein JCM13304A_01440 [Desulfothermus okinawensis JCM 13304]